MARRKKSGPSARDRAEVRAGTASARDRREVAGGNKMKPIKRKGKQKK